MKTRIQNWIVTDLIFGDSGKGAVVDWLCRNVPRPIVIRSNGGPQAAHNVITFSGVHHTFSQFGSGTFAGAETYLSHHMLIEPFAMFKEAHQLEGLGVADPIRQYMIVSPHVRVITPYHQIANRLIELSRGDARHGSCGMGIGECMSDWTNAPQEALYGYMLGDTNAVRRNLRMVRDRKIAQLRHIIPLVKNLPTAELDLRDLYSDEVLEASVRTYQHLAQMLRWMDVPNFRVYCDENNLTNIFEGAQGVLIDELYGFNPYTTWSTTTSKNALELIGQMYYPGERGDTHRLGLIRPYMARHGAGPLPSEFTGARVGFNRDLVEPHNVHNQWQGSMRFGAFDFPLLDYALRATGGVDSFAVSHLDLTSEVYMEWIEVVEGYEVKYGTVGKQPRLELPTTLEESEENTRLLLNDIYVNKYQFSGRDRCSNTALLAMIADKTRIPVSLTGYGRTAADRVWSSETMRVKYPNWF